jgi:hypothetical protein
MNTYRTQAEALRAARTGQVVKSVRCHTSAGVSTLKYIVTGRPSFVMPALRDA